MLAEHCSLTALTNALLTWLSFVVVIPFKANTQMAAYTLSAYVLQHISALSTKVESDS